ncbi:cytochrome P450 [Crepidotus variabilis]|uniref:Cytochrome P450 n=1 Tax=Crepidotus variabilis TaxID=179855 RepID=A0A9P6EFG2_9AGAR|nr:cytochrome P450 [Crepidotus variabilis]
MTSLEINTFSFYQNLAGAFLFISLVVLSLTRTYRSRLSLPPGPRGNFLFGNSIPNAFSYRYFESLTQEYGPVFSLRQGYKTVIVVGRVEAAMHIMETEGASTADRPRNIAAGETLSGGMRVMFTPFGEKFKMMRKALHTHLHPRSVSTYAPLFTRYAKQHILDIIQAPEDHQQHAKKYAVSVVSSLAYGKSPRGAHDPMVQAVSECLKRLGNALRPGFWKVDTYPFLKYIPGYLKELEDGFSQEKSLFVSHLESVKYLMEKGEEAPESFGKYLLERQESLNLTDVETAYLAGGIFGAGSDTTASAISVNVLASACYPDAQQKVWEELEAIVGKERLPRIEDREYLPQTMAFVLETFRWRPVTAGGFAHKVMKDIIWNGYIIPKNASIFGNIWSVGRDPEYFPNPERFDPQRWIKDGKLRDDMKTFAFGWGRRVCPGQYMATASIFINVAMLFWSFKIKAKRDAPIDEWSFTESANAHPMPFSVSFEPRFALSMDNVGKLLEDLSQQSDHMM